MTLLETPPSTTTSPERTNLPEGFQITAYISPPSKHPARATAIASNLPAIGPNPGIGHRPTLVLATSKLAPDIAIDSTQEVVNKIANQLTTTHLHPEILNRASAETLGGLTTLTAVQLNTTPGYTIVANGIGRPPRLIIIMQKPDNVEILDYSNQHHSSSSTAFPTTIIPPYVTRVIILMGPTNTPDLTQREKGQLREYISQDRLPLPLARRLTKGPRIAILDIRPPADPPLDALEFYRSYIQIRWKEVTDSLSKMRSALTSFWLTGLHAGVHLRYSHLAHLLTVLGIPNKDAYDRYARAILDAVNQSTDLTQIPTTAGFRALVCTAQGRRNRLRLTIGRKLLQASDFLPPFVFTNALKGLAARQKELPNKLNDAQSIQDVIQVLRETPLLIEYTTDGNIQNIYPADPYLQLLLLLYEMQHTHTQIMPRHIQGFPNIAGLRDTIQRLTEPDIIF